jgi:hypothetical protein
VANVVEKSGAPPSPVIEVEGSGAPPPLATAATVKEGRAGVETAAPQVVSEPPAGAGSGCADVVMVPSNEDSAPPPLAGDRDVVMSMALEVSPTVGAASVEEVMDMVACRFVDFPGIGTINLDTPELPGNDRELLEAVTEQMIGTIASVASALGQYESDGGSVGPPPPRGARGRRQREFSRNARPTQSLLQLRPRHRRPKRTKARPCPSPQNH